MKKSSELLLPFFHNKFIEAGVDEVGRGCLCRPCLCCGCYSSKKFLSSVIKRFKRTYKRRTESARPIIEKECYSFAVASVTNVEIDRINILQASFKAMHLALNKLKTSPELLLVDGNRFKKYKKLPHQCIIKGDGMYAPIAAASVLANLQG